VPISAFLERNLSEFMNPILNILVLFSFLISTATVEYLINSEVEVHRWLTRAHAH